MMTKAHFLFVDYPKLIESIDPLSERVWGTMNVHQMIEHMSYSVRMANGKDIMQLITPLEKLPVVRDFMLSDKEFRPNTKNSLLGETPEPVKFDNIQDSINELKQELSDFKLYFEKNPNATLMNPFFGELNFEQWIHLLHKHAIHHLKQFNVPV